MGEKNDTKHISKLYKSTLVILYMYFHKSHLIDDSALIFLRHVVIAHLFKGCYVMNKGREELI
jgi:hypothetical protein